MKAKNISIFFIIVLFFIILISATDSGYKSITVNEIKFSWKINGNYLDCILSAPTNGWVAVGFDPTERMENANFIIGYVKDGTAYIQDNWGKSETSHRSDIKMGGKDDILKPSGTEKDNFTEIGFLIPLDSGDKYDTKLTKGKHKIILGYSNKDNFTSKHKVLAKADIVIE